VKTEKQDKRQLCKDATVSNCRPISVVYCHFICGDGDACCDSVQSSGGIQQIYSAENRKPPIPPKIIREINRDSQI